MKSHLDRAAVLVFALTVAAAGCQAQTARSDMRPAAAVADGQVQTLRAMTTRRSVHSATLMRDGKVLIAGGYAGGDQNISAAEVFDPTANAFSPVGSMSTARSSHTASLLPDGRVLIAGGFNGDYLDTFEIYDPARRKFTPAGRLTTPRSGHVAVTLSDGRILLAGGVGTGWTFLKSAEIYDPATGRSAPVGDMALTRESHTATLLDDGRVLITGGHSGRRSQIVIYTSAEIFDPRTGRFTPAGDLTIKRHKHEAVRLNDGRVLIVGGSDERDSEGAYNNAEIFDPRSGRFTAVKQSMNSARYKLQGTAVLLPSGKVLIGGGADRAELFDPVTGTFSYAGASLGSRRLFAAATLLANGKVLLTGGYNSSIATTAEAWLYQI